VANEGKRENTKIANRKAILKAGEQLFCELGYEATSIRNIIKMSGLSTGTFYNYFRTKEEVFEELVDILVEKARASIHASRKVYDSDMKTMVTAFREFFRLFEEEPQLLKFISKNQDRYSYYRTRGKFDGIVADLEADLGSIFDKMNIPKPESLKTISYVIFGTFLEMVNEMANTENYPVEKRTGELATLIQGAIFRMLSPNILG